MIPQLSKLKSHLRKNTSEPAIKPPEALTSPCSPPGPSRRNATSTPRTCSRSPLLPSPPPLSSRREGTSGARHISSKPPTPRLPPSTRAPSKLTVTPQGCPKHGEQLNDPLRPRRSTTLRQPTRTKAEQAAYFQSLRDAEIETWGGPPRLAAANLSLILELEAGYTRSRRSPAYLFDTAPPGPARMRKPSLTQPTRKRAERVAAGDCLGRGCSSAFCAASCVFGRPKPAYSRPQLVAMLTGAEPGLEWTLDKPKTDSFWTSIKPVSPIDPASRGSEKRKKKKNKKKSCRQFIADLNDWLKACGELLLMFVGCTCVLK